MAWLPTAYPSHFLPTPNPCPPSYSGIANGIKSQICVSALSTAHGFILMIRLTSYNESTFNLTFNLEWRPCHSDTHCLFLIPHLWLCTVECSPPPCEEDSRLISSPTPTTVAYPHVAFPLPLLPTPSIVSNCWAINYSLIAKQVKCLATKYIVSSLGTSLLSCFLLYPLK